MSKRLSLTDFVEKANTIHGVGRYDYSKTVLGRNNKEGVLILCNVCGIEFIQTPNTHLRNHGCPNCKLSKIRTGRLLDRETFIKRFVEAHGDLYDYSKFIYTGANEKIVVICKEHGEFYPTPHNHMNGAKCQKCAYADTGKGRRSSTEEFIEKAKNIHGDLYNYDSVNYATSFSKVEIKCNTCSKTFKQTPNTHLAGSGCPSCKKSKGETQIEKLLIENGIRYIPQHTFEDCRNEYPLPFDFYLPEFNLCIEYDGSLHFIPWNKSEKSLKKFEATQLNDKTKTGYCKENSIRLIRIPYWEYKNIPTILENQLLY